MIWKKRKKLRVKRKAWKGILEGRERERRVPPLRSQVTSGHREEGVEAGNLPELLRSQMRKGLNWREERYA